MVYLQIIINSVVVGILLALSAYGFSLVFRITRAFHLAQAGIHVCGVYAYIYALEYLGNSLGGFIGSLSFSIFLVCLLGWLIEKAVYLPIHIKRGNEALTLVGSIGVNAILINFLALLFGNEVKVVPGTWKIVSFEVVPGIIITNLQIIQFSVAAVIIIGLYLMLSRSTQLINFKAVADSYDLAEVSGLNVQKIRTWAMISGSLLVLVASILLTHDIGVEPYSGMGITLSAAVVAILTGNIGVREIFLVAVALTLLQNLIEWYLSAQWREGLTFFFLLVVMLWRTEGVLSYQLRKDK